MKRKIPGLRRVTVWFCAVILADSPSFSHAVLARPSDAEEVKRIWDFSDGVQGWVYDDSWAGDGYHGTGACEQGPEREMLKVSLDYSADVEKGWSQTRISNIKEEKYLVDSTVAPDTRTAVSSTESEFAVNGAVYAYTDSVQLADPDADPSAVALYQYLKAVGESADTLFGHMEDTVLKAGGAAIGESDTSDVTGAERRYVNPHFFTWTQNTPLT